ALGAAEPDHEPAARAERVQQLPSGCRGASGRHDIPFDKTALVLCPALFRRAVAGASDRAFDNFAGDHAVVMASAGIAAEGNFAACLDDGFPADPLCHFASSGLV